jgi:hypothetical protein
VVVGGAAGLPRITGIALTSGMGWVLSCRVPPVRIMANARILADTRGAAVTERGLVSDDQCEVGYAVVGGWHAAQ